MDIANFINDVERWTRIQDTIHALILVGAYGRGEHDKNAAIHFHLITTTPKLYTDNPSFVNNFGVVVESSIKQNGIVTSLQIWYSSGIEADFSITTPIWISTPLEEETKKTLSAGYKVILDKKNYFKKVRVAIK